MNNREQGNMLFLKMCKMEVSSPFTWNIDDPNSLYSLHRHKPISNCWKNTKKFSCTFSSKPIQKAEASNCSYPLEPTQAQLTACPSRSFSSWTRPGEATCVMSLLKGKQLGLDFPSQDLKVIFHWTNERKHQVFTKVFAVRHSGYWFYFSWTISIETSTQSPDHFD